ncbi:UDP-glycosyltransferase 71K1-like [Ziziphus jujuba]|uniref:Glycosyltransferase n=1 Tax=Ziziphus jujuba TaxID=326968 RepID=A0A6P6FXI2_ZIZJJ|nr:UDP-glycosyltransferase 71K1-like [Ziziphus jujuba]
MKKSELVFIPAPGIGHLVSALEFAKRLIDHDDRHSITVLSMKFPFTPFADEFTKSLVASHHGIQVIDLPPVDPPPPELLNSPENFVCAFIESLIPHVRNTLTDMLSSSSRVSGLVLDFFCLSLIDVGNELGVPSYMFLTSNSGFLGLMLHIPIRHNQKSAEFEESDAEVSLPGFWNPVPVSVLPGAVFDKDGGYSAYLKLAKRFRDTKGIIVNTFSELELDSVKSLSDGETPPVYMVGPVIDLKGQPNPSLDQAQREKIMHWLDDQPESSVVYLCFGSMGTFGAIQLREIATGLERSGHRFLWSMRVPQPAKGPDDILPEGFSERIGGRGLICGWAPQMEVLAHKAIKGFVSHCGWNSILESLWFGVPIATWPIYAEQQMNAFRMVKEFGLAVEMKLDYRLGDLVMADEIEIAVRRLMDDSDELRKKVKEMGEMARQAIIEGGSSYIAVGQLIEDILGSISCDN